MIIRPYPRPVLIWPSTLASLIEAADKAGTSPDAVEEAMGILAAYHAEKRQQELLTSGGGPLGSK